MERMAGRILKRRVRAKLNTPKRLPPIGNGIAKQSCDTLSPVNGPDINPFEEQNGRAAASIHIIMPQRGLSKPDSFIRSISSDERDGFSTF